MDKKITDLKLKFKAKKIEIRFIVFIQILRHTSCVLGLGKVFFIKKIFS